MEQIIDFFKKAKLYREADENTRQRSEDALELLLQKSRQYGTAFAGHDDERFAREMNYFYSVAQDVLKFVVLNNRAEENKEVLGKVESALFAWSVGNKWIDKSEERAANRTIVCASGNSVTATGQFFHEVSHDMMRGEKVKAYRAIREKCECGLADAKYVAEMLLNEFGNKQKG